MASFGNEDERVEQPTAEFGGGDVSGAGFGANDAVVDTQKTLGENIKAIPRGINVGFAEGAGGMIDFLNPFDKPTFGFLPGTGSAVEGIKNVFEFLEEGSTKDIPEGVMGDLAVGSGEALAAFAPVVKGLQLLKPIGGAVGAFADDALISMQSALGLTTEVIAGGTGKAAQQAAADAGAGPVLSSIAGIAGGALALPAVLGAPKGAAVVASKLPLAGAVMRTGREAVSAVAPMTAAGARETAAVRLRGLAGGEERAEELAGMIKLDDPIGLTPAQQTGDPNLLGLERAAGRESPLVRESLAARGEESAEAAITGVREMGGDVGDARAFFDERLTTFRQNMTASADAAIAKGEAAVAALDPNVPESVSSSRMVAHVRDALDVELTKERDIWAAVPKEALISTQSSRDAMADLVANTPKAQQGNIPDVALRLLNRTKAQLEGTAAVGKNQIQDEDTVAELHGLYSELRAVARNAMSGDNKNSNLARQANLVADAILEDLGAVDGNTPVGQAINEARAFSRSLHETFDQGAVGQVLRRTITTDTAIAPEAAAGRTVGRGGVEGKLAVEGITGAAPASQADIQDFVRGKFSDAILSPEGEFTPKSAARFLRNNEEMLADLPELQRELRAALTSRNSAAMFSVRNSARATMAEASSAPARFNIGQEQKAVLSILSADDPAAAARSVVATARKDTTGAALEGVKAAFTDKLIGSGDVTGAQMQAMLKDRSMRTAMQEVFTDAEMGRLNRIASSMAKLKPEEVADVGGVIDASANKLIEMVVRIAAAKRGGSMGGGSMGGSMQTANIFTERARAMLRNLTNTRARALLMDAVEDPKLFRDLLLIPKGVTLPPATRTRLAPYLTGAAAAQINEGPQ